MEVPRVQVEAAPEPLAEAVCGSGQVLVARGDPNEVSQRVRLTGAVELHPHQLAIDVHTGSAETIGSNSSNKLGEADQRKHVRGRGCRQKSDKGDKQKNSH